MTSGESVANFAPVTVSAGLSVQKLPATAAPLSGEPLVLLHGWGADSRIWEPVLDELNRSADLWLVDLPGFGASAPSEEYSLESILAQLLEAAPARAIYLGWSLGGMLATALAALCPQRVTGLITLAANASFMAREEWPWAMPVKTFEEFYRSFGGAPLQTLKRFCGLQAQGDARERELLKWLRQRLPDAAPSEVTADNWRSALSLLAEIDNSAALSELNMPGLHLLGANDRLVPAAAGERLAALSPTQKVVILPDAGHAPHISQPQKVAASVTDFVRETNCRLDKHRVAQSFSRAAVTYDSVAGLQREVGARLLQLQAVQRPHRGSSVIVDLGSGTGYFSEKLRWIYPDAEVIGLDIAAGMLQHARNRCDAAIHWLCGDAESLPLADKSVDLVFSSLTLQWCERLTPLFRELRRVLKPGGRLAFSTLGPATLQELRQAWRAVDDFTHVNRFVPASELQSFLYGCEFASLQWETETRLRHYRELRELTHELKALGAHNVNHGRSAGLTGRRRVQAFRRAYEDFRGPLGLPATYEVYYSVCRPG